MESVIAAFFVLFLQGLGTAGLCFYAVRDRITRPRGRVAAFLLLLSALYGAVLAAIDVSDFSDRYPGLKFMASLLFLAAGYAYMRLCVRDRWPRLLFVLFMAANAFGFCQSVTFLFCFLCFPDANAGPYVYADILLFGVPILVFSPMFGWMMRRLYRRLLELEDAELKHIYVVPAMFAVLYLLAGNLFPATLIGEASSNGVQLVIVFCAFLTYSQMTRAIVSASKAARERETLRQVNNQLAIQAARMDEMAAHAGELRRIRHDQRQHVAALKGLLAKGDTAQALAYLREYEAGIQERVRPPLCENYVADALCQQYEVLARQAGVETDLVIGLPQDLGVSGSDLSVILGNLWENAIAAASSAPKENRRVQLRARVQDERVMIQMENGFSGQVLRQGDRFFSTKRGNGKDEGIGIASVRAIVDRYGGMADFSYTADTFTASVLLYPRKP